MKGAVTVKRFLGKYINYFIDIGVGDPIEVTADTSSAERIYEPGQTIYLTVNVKRINLFSKDVKTTLIEGIESNVL